MKRLLALFALALFSAPAFAQDDTQGAIDSFTGKMMNEFEMNAMAENARLCENRYTGKSAVLERCKEEMAKSWHYSQESLDVVENRRHMKIWGVCAERSKAQEGLTDWMVMEYCIKQELLAE